MENVAGIVAVALGTLLFALGRDRFPRVARTATVVGLLVLIVGLGMVFWTTPLVAAGMISLFALLTFLLSWVEASALWKARPATQADVSGWSDVIELLVALDWIFTDAWILELGQAYPTFLSFERYPDGTRIGCVGRHANGGVITIETFLDDGEGMLVTMRGRSSTLRPPWMFRQELNLPLEELIRHHDEALFRLRMEGIEPAPPFPGDGLAFERHGSRKLRTHVTRRWYLWAIRPIALRLFPSRKRPLSDQEDLERQLRRYHKTKPESSVL